MIFGSKKLKHQIPSPRTGFNPIPFSITIEFASIHLGKYIFYRFKDIHFYNITNHQANISPPLKCQLYKLTLYIVKHTQ